MRVKKKTENVYTVTPFGRFVRHLRDRRGQSCVDMADTLDISRVYLSAMELGIRNCPIPLYVINRISDRYSLNEDEIVVLLDVVSDANKNLSRLCLDHISDEDKQKILNYAISLMLK